MIVEYAHAKWISQNCPKGTKVIVHEGVNDPLITKQIKGAAGTNTTKSLPEPPTVESIEMTPSSEFTIAIGETRQLSCTFKPSGAQSALEWKSTNTKRGTVNSSGWVSAIGEGDFEIEVKTKREGKKDKFKFTVVDKPKDHAQHGRGQRHHRLYGLYAAVRPADLAARA